MSVLTYLVYNAKLSTFLMLGTCTKNGDLNSECFHECSSYLKCKYNIKFCFKHLPNSTKSSQTQAKQGLLTLSRFLFNNATSEIKMSKPLFTFFVALHFTYCTSVESSWEPIVRVGGRFFPASYCCPPFQKINEA